MINKKQKLVNQSQRNRKVIYDESPTHDSDSKLINNYAHVIKAGNARKTPTTPTSEIGDDEFGVN
tara:strand:- start:4171 stop:4365 length:195 start_codon:yes stop_codon:yes gene_type:complete